MVRATPMAAISNPFRGLSPLRLEMIASPKMPSAQNCTGPNLSATTATGSEISIKAVPPTTPPKVEPTSEAPSALPGCPFWFRGKPSMTVAVAAAVPGVPMSTAEIEPPYSAAR